MVMRYISTRGLAPAQTFTQILLGGLAPDGGLYVPETYPQFKKSELAAMREMDYPQLALAVLSRLADDMPGEDLRAIIDNTYTPAVYCNGRNDVSTVDITPLLTLEPGLHLLCLSNGPTLAFKDMAMQLLGNLFEYVLADSKQTLNILGATSGDTGSAAEYAMRGKSGIQVFMLSPLNKMSRFQTAQMYSLQDANIHNIAVNGVFDDCQDLVKAVSNDQEFKRNYHIGAVNSINWARIAAQIVYYFKAYFAATHHDEQSVSFAVPSGNFGNVCAGHIARMMGLPIKQLIVANNENDVLDEFFKTGVYRPRDAAQTYHTSSPSMDISKASNFERFVFDLSGRDSARMRAWWAKVDRGEGIDLKSEALFDSISDYGMLSGSSNHACRMETIRDTWEKYGVMIDPHTADGLKVALEYFEPGVPMIVLETAQPAKFDDAIQEALDRTPERPEGMQNLENQPQRYTVMDADIEAIEQFIMTQTHRHKLTE